MIFLSLVKGERLKKTASTSIWQRLYCYLEQELNIEKLK